MLYTKKFRVRFCLSSLNHRNQKSSLLPCGGAGLFIICRTWENEKGEWRLRCKTHCTHCTSCPRSPAAAHFSCSRKLPSERSPHEPYQTKPRSCCSSAPCTCDGVLLGGQPFLAAREYQFLAPRAPFFSHDHRSGSSTCRILQRPFLPFLSEAYEEPADGAGIPLSLLLYLHAIHE